MCQSTLRTLHTPHSTTLYTLHTPHSSLHTPHSPHSTGCANTFTLELPHAVRLKRTTSQISRRTAAFLLSQPCFTVTAHQARQSAAQAAAGQHARPSAAAAGIGQQKRRARRSTWQMQAEKSRMWYSSDQRTNVRSSQPRHATTLSWGFATKKHWGIYGAQSLFEKTPKSHACRMKSKFTF